MLKTDGLRCWAQIDTDAIAHNVKEIQKLVGDTKVMGIVKANAYGHGALACTKALQKAGLIILVSPVCRKPLNFEKEILRIQS